MPAAQDDILNQADAWRQSGQGVALATVVRTWGSSPRPVGSHLAVNQEGRFVGSVSGGCIEGAVIAEALAAIADGQPRLLEFGVSDEQAWEVGLACGGRVQVHVERVKPDFLTRLLAARAAKRPAALVTRLSDHAQVLFDGDEASGGLELDAAQRAALGERWVSGESGPLDAAGDLFARVYAPAPRLIIVGAVHIAQALAPMAAMAGYEVALIDPRRAFGSAGRFPGLAVSDEWPDEGMTRLMPDGQTAVVTLTHDPKLDDPALAVALNSPAFYIGALGSRRTHEKRLARLRQLGLGEEQLERIHAPVGLDLGGRYPAEIAVAILAEIIRVRYQGRGR
ncbi:MAG: XdhC family protein [Azonexus sp.]|jgi:xanthine dehydrogenase accessory factor|nr:XdhC family protein [Azonexus sp.]